MRRTLSERGLERGQEKDQLLVKMLKDKAPYAEIVRALLKLEKRWLREAITEAERLQTRRGMAEDLVTLAYSFNTPWTEFGKWIRRVQRLGFSNLSLRVHITCLYIQSLHLFPQQTREAWSLLEETERRVRRLRRERPLREEHLEAIAHARRTAGPAPHPGPNCPGVTVRASGMRKR